MLVNRNAAANVAGKDLEVTGRFYAEVLGLIHTWFKDPDGNILNVRRQMRGRSPVSMSCDQRFGSRRHAGREAPGRDSRTDTTQSSPERAFEVRRLFELDEFGPSEAVERFRQIGVGAE
ncbi:hypothetical protein BH24PSE2_BH24PSE2_12530 [soil metagenome]